MNKLEAIKYLLSKIKSDSTYGLSCVREIVEDVSEPITKEAIDDLIDYWFD